MPSIALFCSAYRYCITLDPAIMDSTGVCRAHFKTLQTTMPCLSLQMANAKKGGTPAAATNGRSTPGSLKRGPGRPPKKVSFLAGYAETCNTLFPIQLAVCSSRHAKPVLMFAQLSACKPVCDSAFGCKSMLCCTELPVCAAASKHSEQRQQWHYRKRTLCHGSVVSFHGFV